MKQAKEVKKKPGPRRNVKFRVSAAVELPLPAGRTSCEAGVDSCKTHRGLASRDQCAVTQEASAPAASAQDGSTLSCLARHRTAGKERKTYEYPLEHEHALGLQYWPVSSPSQCHLGWEQTQKMLGLA